MCVCVRVCVRARAYVCVCVCARARVVYSSVYKGMIARFPPPPPTHSGNERLCAGSQPVASFARRYHITYNVPRKLAATVFTV